MPRLLVQAPHHDRGFSLGWLGLSWMEALTLHGDGDVLGMPVRHTDELSGLVVDAYALNAPGTVATGKVGRRIYDSVFFSRPKGTDKSGQAARFSMFEAFGPCRFAGIAEGGEVYRDPYGLGFEYVYTKGEPMGRHLTSPFIRVMATEEGQTGNVYDVIHYNLTEGPLADALDRRDDAGLSRIIVPKRFRGEITPSTASAASKDGGKETFVDFDETHLYNNPELRRMYQTVTRNLRKRKKLAETWFLETTTMFAEGEDSIAERTLKFAELLHEGRTRSKPNQLLDWRWGECDDVTDIDKLKAGIADAMGDAMAWQDIDSLVDDFYDPRNEAEDSRRYFLNARGSHSNAYIKPQWWAAVGPQPGKPPKIVKRTDAVVLGFDGSRRRSRGVTDATALIGCRVSDGHLFEIAVWEQPPNWPKRTPDGKPAPGWAIPQREVDKAVRRAFRDYNVVGMFADPAGWETWVASWTASFRSKLKVKASQAQPMEWWMTGEGKKVYEALVSFEDAVLEHDLSHDGSDALRRHVGNARRRKSKAGYGIAKETPESANKIDACVAAVLAHQCRLEALAKGLGVAKKPRSQPQRIK